MTSEAIKQNRDRRRDGFIGLLIEDLIDEIGEKAAICRLARLVRRIAAQRRRQNLVDTAAKKN